METMGDLIATLTDQEKVIIKILATGVHGSALKVELKRKEIPEEVFRNLVDKKVTLEQLTVLMHMATEWL